MVERRLTTENSRSFVFVVFSIAMPKYIKDRCLYGVAGGGRIEDRTLEKYFACVVGKMHSRRSGCLIKSV